MVKEESKLTAGGSVKARAAIMEDIGQMAVREFNIPNPVEGQVLVRLQNCNVCTTDWQTWTGARKSQKRAFPWAPGHEEAGVIVKVGPGVTEYEVGDHVALGYGGCGYCHACRTGNTRGCPNRHELVRDGVAGSFGMCQYYVADLIRVFKMNPALPLEEACYLEPLATAVHGIRKLRVSGGDTLIVIGAGNLGLVNAQLARAFGCKVLVSEINPERCEIASSLGFSVVNPMEEDISRVAMEFTSGYGIDAVILAVGNTAATDQALKVVRRSGKVLFFASGYPSPDLNLDVNGIHYGGYELIGTGGANLVDFELSARMLSDGTITCDQLVSYRVPLDEVQRAFELASTPGNYRVSLVLWP